MVSKVCPHSKEPVETSSACQDADAGRNNDNYLLSLPLRRTEIVASKITRTEVTALQYHGVHLDGLPLATPNGPALDCHYRIVLRRTWRR